MARQGNSPRHTSARQVSKYLARYVEAYRREHQRFVQEPPAGGGFPSLDISPYLHTRQLHGYLARDGVAIADYSWQPDDTWAISGGPALIVDMAESRTPPEILALHQPGEHVGLYRIVSQHAIPRHVWSGQLPKPTATHVIGGGDFEITVSEYPLSWRELLAILTFGATEIVDLQLPTSMGPFWTPRIVRDLGFATADRQHQRFFHYLELLPHMDTAAWDVRSIWARVHVDVLRDFATAVGRAERGREGEISFTGSGLHFVYRPADRLTALETAIREFESLLAAADTTDEAVYHEFIRTHPVMLDVYATAYSKPQLVYPAGESPLGKAYVEPDFILLYPDNTYRLVELEKPRDQVTTRSGQPRAEVTHAAFQIGEWRDYILNHYELLKAKFPHISSSMRSTIVIGRTRGGADVERRASLVRQTYKVDDVWTYDDILRRARKALSQLALLNSSSEPT